MESTTNAPICLITGATSGIGRATARKLAAQGAAVLITGRNAERGECALREIRRETENDRVELLLADFAVQEEVRQLAADAKQRCDRLDVLINNAGTYLASKEITPDGIEKTFAINHLAPFLLTNLLLDHLTSDASRPARIVNISSDAHRGANEVDIDYVRTAGEGRGYNGMLAYAQSKLANILFTYALAQRLDPAQVTANAVHPGVVSTRIWNRNRDIASLFMRLVKPFLTRPATSADALAYLATAPKLEGVTGTYFKKKKEARSSKVSYDREQTERLWQMSEELTDCR